MAEPNDQPTDDEVVEVSGGSLASGGAGGDSPAPYDAAGPEAGASDPEVRSVAPFVDDDDDVDDVDGRLDLDSAADDELAVDSPADADADGEPVARSKRRGRKTSAEQAAAASSAGSTVTRRVVTSKRVTPKGGGQAGGAAKKAKGQTGDDAGLASSRSTPPGGQGAYAKGPSPWWVPTLMFGLLIIGALVIITNYMGVFGEAANTRLVIGLAFILGGIITATQYR